MKKFLLILVAAALAVVPALSIAQGTPPQFSPEQKKRMEEMREKQYATLQKSLDLKPEQVKKMKALDGKMQAKMTKLFQEPGDMKVKQPKMMKIQTEMMAELKKILNPEQFKKLMGMMSQMRQGMGGGAPGGN
jgi:Spy/CpxP family protein refolding chaperone